MILLISNPFFIFYFVVDKYIILFCSYLFVLLLYSQTCFTCHGDKLKAQLGWINGESTVKIKVLKSNGDSEVLKVKRNTKMTNIGDNQVGQMELSIENKGFIYDEETSSENVTTHKDRGATDISKQNSGLNYDKILDHIGQFGRYTVLITLRW